MLSRCFIAINLPDTKKERFIPVLKELREIGVNTVLPIAMHFTVKFLGDIRPDILQKTIDKLSKIEPRNFEIKLRGVGAYPNREYVKVLWAGVESKGLEKLADRINIDLEKIFPKENFTPHLTLGRVKRKLNLDAFFKKHRNDRFGSFYSDSFELMQSEFSSTGPRYSVLWSSAKE